MHMNGVSLLETEVVTVRLLGSRKVTIPPARMYLFDAEVAGDLVRELVQALQANVRSYSDYARIHQAK
jgi:hypothetical protein